MNPNQNPNPSPVKKPKKKATPKKTPTKTTQKKTYKKRKKEEEIDLVSSGGPTNFELCKINLELFKKLVPNIEINLSLTKNNNNSMEQSSNSIITNNERQYQTSSENFNHPNQNNFQQNNNNYAQHSNIDPQQQYNQQQFLQQQQYLQQQQQLQQQFNQQQQLHQQFNQQQQQYEQQYTQQQQPKQRESNIPQINPNYTHMNNNNDYDHQIPQPFKKLRSEMNINLLSLPILKECFSYLDFSAILEARLVNKRFHELAMDCSVWEELHLEVLPNILISSVEYYREFVWNKLCMWPLHKVKKIFFRSEMINLSLLFINYFKNKQKLLGDKAESILFPNATEIIEVRGNGAESSANFQSILRCVNLVKIEKLKLNFSIMHEIFENMLKVFVSLKSIRISSMKGDLSHLYNLVYSQKKLLHIHFGREVQFETSKMVRMTQLQSLSLYWNGKLQELFSLAKINSLKSVHLHFSKMEGDKSGVTLVNSYMLNHLTKLHLINEENRLEYPLIIKSENLKQLRFVNTHTREIWKKMFSEKLELFDISNLQAMDQEREMHSKIHQDNFYTTIQYMYCPYLTRLLVCNAVFNDTMLTLIMKKCPNLAEIELQYTFNERIHINSDKLKILRLESLSRLSFLSLECPALYTLKFTGKFHNSFHLGLTSWAMSKFVFNSNELQKESSKNDSDVQIYKEDKKGENENDMIFISPFAENSQNTIHVIRVNCPNLSEFACRSNTLELEQINSIVFHGNVNQLKKITLNLGKNMWREKMSKKFSFSYPNVSSASFACLISPQDVDGGQLSIFKFPLKMDSLVNLQLSNFQIKQKWIQQNFFSNYKLTKLVLDNIFIDTATILFVKEIFGCLRVLKLKKLNNTVSLSIRLPTLKHLTLVDCEKYRGFAQFECESLETFIFCNCPQVENHEISKWKPQPSLKTFVLGGVRINLFSLEMFPILFKSLKYIHYFPLLVYDNSDLNSQTFLETLLSLGKNYPITFSESPEEWLYD